MDCTLGPLTAPESQEPETIEEIVWTTMFVYWPELLNLPRWEAIQYVILARIAAADVDDLEYALEKILSATCFEGNEVEVLWLEGMEPYHRAVVVGNIAVFDEEAASLGKLRFIWFDAQGDVVREARVGVEHAQELATFKYGDSLKNPQFSAWWNDPTNLRVGPDYAP